jgi:hypothetical protein
MVTGAAMETGVGAATGVVVVGVVEVEVVDAVVNVGTTSSAVVTACVDVAERDATYSRATEARRPLSFSTAARGSPCL